jgi:hypothetical protein
MDRDRFRERVREICTSTTTSHEHEFVRVDWVHQSITAFQQPRALPVPFYISPSARSQRLYRRERET